MCGPFIHGRSWWDENIKGWEHFCDPYKINSHNEMPMETIGELLHVETVYFTPDMSETDMARSTQRIHTLYLEYQMVWGLDVSITAIRKPDNTVDYVISKGSAGIDWGIEPSVGNLVLQRGDQNAWKRLGIQDDIAKQNYLPRTRKQLTQWAMNHWGKRSDGDEFLSGMPGCLDVERLWPQLPDSIKKCEAVRGSMTIKSLTIGGKDIAPVTGGVDFEMDSRGKKYLAARHAIRAARKPCNRWAEMFKEAPNEFWAARN